MAPVLRPCEELIGPDVVSTAPEPTLRAFADHGRVARTLDGDPAAAQRILVDAAAAGVRRYLAWAEQCASQHDLTPAQVQLAWAVRASEDPDGPTLTELAHTLLRRHQSVVGLVDGVEQAGLVQRVRDDVQLSRVHGQLSSDETQLLEVVSAKHLQRVAEFGPALGSLWSSFADHSVPKVGYRLTARQAASSCATSPIGSGMRSRRQVSWRPRFTDPRTSHSRSAPTATTGRRSSCSRLA
jgi:DNA-binding MarR family transcriptional regulator